ncbi:putative gustatory receptor 28b [Cotesia glomerata]|uniref:putative gustatory receptor 28b n=1 Tax=Cotesia glomerata TaxID=32391 RepID=UPI001D011D50|nr:putative gustatory receptor 28b [Cotesia glomerata]
MKPARFTNQNKKKFDFNQWNSICSRYFMCIQYICFKILGLAPWTLNMSKVLKKNQKARFCGRNICSYSCIGSCYNIILVIICFALNCDFLFKKTSTLLDFDSQMSALVLTRYVLIFSALIISLNNIVLTIYQKSLIKIINKFENMNKKLRLLNGYSHSYEPEFDFTMYFLFIFNFFVLGISKEIQTINNFQLIVMIINQIVVDFITSGVIMQHTIFLTMIIKRLEKINSALSKLLGAKIIGNQAHALSTISTIQSSIFSDVILSDLNNIISAYIDLCEICENLQDIYGFPILISTVTLSIRNTFYMYLLFLHYFVGLSSMKYGIYDFVILLSWCIFLLIILTSSVTKAVNQSKKMVKLVDLLLIRYYADQQLKEKLTNLSSFLTIAKIDFTACEMIPLNRTLLAMTASTIASYIVIAIQFKINSTSK